MEEKMKIPTFFALAVVALTPGAIAETMPSEALLLLDGNGDSLVTFEEFSQKMNSMFDPMDTNQNGQLDFEEVESFMGSDLFKAADVNGSGGISKQEYGLQIKKDFESADKNGNGSLD
jgi:hypothetical protein